MEIRQLVNFVHSTMPAYNRERLVIGYPARSTDTKMLQHDLLMVDTSTVAETVWAIQQYLVIRNSNRPTCKTVGEGTESSQLTQLTSMLTAQSEMSTAQSEVLLKLSRVLRYHQPQEPTARLLAGLGWQLRCQW